jgi:hypothetical protein
MDALRSRLRAIREHMPQLGKDPPVEPIGASYQPKLRSEREAAQARYQALMSAQAEREALTRARRAAKPRVASSDLGAAYRNRAE